MAVVWPVLLTQWFLVFLYYEYDIFFERFGAKIRSPSTGIILNNEMDDFSSPKEKNFYGLPPSPLNFIKPDKRPASSMTPSIVLTQAGDPLYVLGASGGSKILSAISYVGHFFLIL